VRNEIILGGGAAGGYEAPSQWSERVAIADRDSVVGAIMLAPAVIYVTALVAGPFFLAVALSLSDATVGNPGIHQFVGLDNFTSVVR
jgi:multiple sugar transport system permease protein